MAGGIKNFAPLWGEWEIDELLGKGSYGEVYKIHKIVNGIRVEAAAKHISIPKDEDKKAYRKYTQQELVTLFEERAEKFSIEISSMLKLRQSQNVVRYEDHIKAPKKDGIGWDIIIRMELLTPLEDYLDVNSFNRRDVVKLGIDLCSAIECCQQNDIIHRDIKIENIFVDANGVYKLGDFGVSKVGSGTATGTVTGTEDYMAPEISQEHKYNKTVDIYALGIAMYQLLNNRRKPFIDADSVPGQEAEGEAHLKRITGQQMPAPKYADAELARIVLKACAFDRHDRYASPTEMANDLRNILETLPEDPIITPRERFDLGSDTDNSVEQTFGGAGETISDFGNERGGKTISDLGIDRRGSGTVSDISTEPIKRKKSKVPLIVGLSAVLIAIIVAAVILLSSKDVPLEYIAGIPEEQVQVVIGDKHELNIEPYPKSTTSKVTYGVDDETIATIDKNGVITTHNTGSVVVTVYVDGKEYKSFELNVEEQKIPVTDIVGVASSAELLVGSSTTINARVQPDDATVQTITYTSSNPAIATVGPDGVVTAVSAGDVRIIASADGVESVMNLTVKAQRKNTTKQPVYTPPTTTTPQNDSSNDKNSGGGSGVTIANPDGDSYD